MSAHAFRAEALEEPDVSNHGPSPIEFGRFFPDLSLMLCWMLA